MIKVRTLALALLTIFSVGIANGQTWTPLTNPAPVSMGAMLLLTDGRVLVHEEPNCNPGTGCVGNNYGVWYTLTPDINGSYVNGTWTQVATLPSGYEPLFFSSAVLPDGKVVIAGGEYNCPSGNCSGVWTSLAALYDPVANTWASITPAFPTSWEAYGDAESVVLPNGTWLATACCAKIVGKSTFPLYYNFNEAGLSFTSEASATDGQFDDFDEQGLTLLPNGNVLTVDAYVGQYSKTGMNSEIYNPSTNTWTSAGSTGVQLWDSDCGNENGASYELGPAVLMPNGTIFQTGASSCAAGNTATYNWSTGVWTTGPVFPNKDAANDAPASIETNGNVIVMGSPFSGTFSSPSNFYEWNGSTLTSYPNPSRASSDASYVGHLLVLPTGQIMFTDFSTTVEILTTAGTYQSAWQPTITTFTSNLTPGSTYSISGTQFNGLTQGAAYGDDFQDATNYPLVQIVNNSTHNVAYAKTHGHSTMGVATGSAIVSTNFDVPAGIETGASTLYVIANGIPSAGVAVTVGSSSSGFSLSANPTAVSVAQGSSGSSTITSTTTGGFDSAVTLSATGQPTGVTVTFNPTSITGNGTSTMTMAVASTTVAGTYPITVKGTSGSTVETTTVTLTVTSSTKGSFTLAIAPKTVSIAPGGHGAAKLTATATGGFNSAIALSAKGQPTGVNIVFNPASIAGGAGTAAIQINSTAKAAAGSYTITVTGTGGGVTATATFTLTIT